MDFDASELRSLATSLDNVPKALGHLARTVVRKTAKDIESSAKLIAPRDPARPPQDPSRPVTGNLKGSIGTSDLRAMGTSGSIEAEIRATAEYAMYQEVGTSRMPARPFMGPATDKHSPAFAEAMAQIAAQAVSGA